MFILYISDKKHSKDGHWGPGSWNITGPFLTSCQISPIELYCWSIWSPLWSLSSLHTPCLKTTVSAQRFLDATLDLKSLWEVSVPPTLESCRLQTSVFISLVRVPLSLAITSLLPKHSSCILSFYLILATQFYLMAFATRLPDPWGQRLLFTSIPFI